MDKKTIEKTNTAELEVTVEKAPRLKTGLKGGLAVGGLRAQLPALEIGAVRGIVMK